MLTLALANIRTYARRFVAVVLAVLIGTAFLAAAQMVNASTQASLEKSIGESYQGVDAVAELDWARYSGDGTGQLTTSDVQAAAAVNGVAAVRGEASYGARLDTGTTSLAVGVRQVSEEPWEPVNVVEGDTPTSNREILIDAISAEEAELAVGDTVTLLTGDSSTEVRVTVSGLAAPSMNPLTAATAQVYALPHLITATQPPEARRTVDALHLLLDDPASADVVLPRVGEALADSAAGPVSVRTAQEQTMAEVNSMAGGDEAVTWILLVFVLIALVVTALVVVNTFSVLLAQRSRELALLRTVGASRRQLNRSVLTEAFLVGLVASVLGVAVAWGVMSVLAAVARTALEAPFVTIAVPPLAMLGTVAVGIVLTMSAAWWPARRATRVAPLEAMRPQEAATESARLGWFRLSLGGLLALGGSGLLAWGALGGELLLGFAGGALSFIGVLLLAPLVILPAVRGLSRLTARGVPSRLAGLNAARNPARTAATATALMIGVTLVTMMMTGAQTAKATFDARLASEYPVDVTVDGQLAGVAFDQQDVDAVGGLDGVTAAVLLTPAAVSHAGLPLYAAATESLARVVNQPDYLPAAGQVVLPQGYREDVVVNTADGERTLEAIASQAVTLTPIVTPATAAEIVGEGAGDHQPVLWLKVDDALTPAQALDVRSAVASTLGIDEYSVSGGAIEKGLFTQIIDALLMVVVGLLAVAVLIAVVGVTNTLSLSVLERTRENSLLRALGLRAAQLRHMLSAEAILIGTTAALVGTVLGSIYGVLGVQSALSRMADTVISLPWWQLVGVLSVAVLASWLASVVPGRRSARLSPVEGLASD
ncbi:FtsX-like permease family protein [Zhihengliuella flava]|uniref:ABC transport system permease protein n=1 Tax=Zhihengliuella flava TaxID=1285193 RepID=A0A931GEI8_9MICC|nr:ABC transporter permease [Zhihengliuella flava]MBG6083582.1 putative ABC transport system permease protein [Zhihengliuella flava]